MPPQPVKIPAISIQDGGYFDSNHSHPLNAPRYHMGTVRNQIPLRSRGRQHEESRSEMYETTSSGQPKPIRKAQSGPKRSFGPDQWNDRDADKAIVGPVIRLR